VIGGRYDLSDDSNPDFKGTQVFKRQDTRQTCGYCRQLVQSDVAY